MDKTYTYIQADVGQGGGVVSKREREREGREGGRDNTSVQSMKAVTSSRYNTWKESQGTFMQSAL